MKTLTLASPRLPAVAAFAAALVASSFCLLPSARAADAAASLPPVDHYVYLSFLPEPSELQADARKNGLEVLRLDKTADAVVVSYRYPDGHTATLGYKLLDAAGAADRVASRTIGSTATYSNESQPVRTVERVEVVERPSTTTEVVYVDRPYRTYTTYYSDPWDSAWAPLTIGLGLGYVGGYYSNYHHHYNYYTPRYSYHNRWNGGYRGGYHGGYRGGRRH